MCASRHSLRNDSRCGVLHVLEFVVVVHCHQNAHQQPEKWLLRHSRIRCNFHFEHRNLSPFIHTMPVDVIRRRRCRRSYATFHGVNAIFGCNFSPSPRRNISKWENNASQHLSCATENYYVVRPLEQKTAKRKISSRIKLMKENHR